MRNKNLIASLALFAGSSLAGGSFAASVPGDVVYQRTDSFNQSVSLSDSFMVSTPGLYKVTLTDLKNAKPFLSSKLDVKAQDNPLGSLSGPGSFSFEAGAGEHDLSFFATVGEPDITESEKKELVEEERKKSGSNWWHSLTSEQKAEQKSLWATWSDEQWQAHRDKVYRRNERRVEEQLASMYTGEYGIEITQTMLPDEASVVPVPAAVWLFGSGLLALVGAARRKTVR